MRCFVSNSTSLLSAILITFHISQAIEKEASYLSLIIYICILLQAFADALLVIPKILAQNSGYDPQETIVKLQVIESITNKSNIVLQVSIF